MLIALFYVIYTFFGGVDLINVRIEDSVVDPERRSAALAAIDRVAAVEQTLVDRTEEVSAALYSLHLQHGASRADYVDALRPLQEARREAAAVFLSVHQELRGQLTRDEWAKVFPLGEE